MSTGSPLAGQLSWCGRLMIATLAVAAVSFVERLDAKGWQLDYDLLGLVEWANSQFTEEKTVDPRAQQMFKRLFVEKDPDKDGDDAPAVRYEESKRKLAEWLSDCAVRGAEDPEALLSPDRKGNPTFCLYHFLLTNDERRVLREIPREDDMVDHFLKRLSLSEEDRDAEHVVALEEPLPALNGEELPPLRSVRLRADGIHVEFGEVSGGIPEEVVKLKAEVSEVRCPSMSIIVPYRAELGFSGVLHTLEKHGLDSFGPREEERLRAAYGGMPMSLAKDIASSAFVDAYGKVNIFGFAFSSRHFPFLVASVLMILSATVAVTVRSARKGSTAVISRSGDATTADALLQSGIGRKTVWLLTPLAAIGLSLPFGVFSRTDYYWSGVAAGLVAVMGLWSVVAARKL